MTEGIVSIIIPSYNKAEYIRETIDSVLEQQGVEVDVVVVDDGSTDATQEILESYGARIRVHKLPGNSGAAHARNVGAQLARGDFLMFLDADDVLTSGTLVALVSALDGRAGCVAACPWQRIRQHDGEWIVYSPDKPLAPPGGDAVTAWLGNWYIPPCAILWPRAVFAASGGWDEELAATDDEELMIRVLLRGTNIVPAAAGEARYRYFATGGTLSTTPTERLAAGRLRGLMKIEREAAAQGLLERYQLALGRKYYQLARSYLTPYPDLVLQSLRSADRLLSGRGIPGRLPHRLAVRVLGLERKERLTRWIAGRGWARGARSGSTTPVG